MKNPHYSEFPKHMYHGDLDKDPIIAHNPEEETEARAKGYVDVYIPKFSPTPMPPMGGGPETILGSSVVPEAPPVYVPSIALPPVDPTTDANLKGQGIYPPSASRFSRNKGE